MGKDLSKKGLKQKRKESLVRSTHAQDGPSQKQLEVARRCQNEHPSLLTGALVGNHLETGLRVKLFSWGEQKFLLFYTPKSPPPFTA
jgi:hypothetical protein